MIFNLDRKKIFFAGLIVLLLIGIPVSLYALHVQETNHSEAEASTNLTFSPTSSSTAPLTYDVGNNIPLTINIDPGQNLVSFVKLDIQYDPTILATIAGQPAFVPNTASFPSVLEGPIYKNGQIEVTLSVGPDPTKAIQAVTTAGTLTLQAIATTNPSTPTLVTFATDTQVLSIGPNDQASENVLSSATPATIIVDAAGSATPTSGQGLPTATPSPTAPITPSDTPVPSTTITPTPAVSPTPVPAGTTLTPTPTSATGVTTTDVAPTCSALDTDRATTGDAPFSLTFTANGNSTTSTINQVTFNFGDGSVSNVTTGGGLGTASVNVQIAHTYNNPGTYNATATLTDTQSMTSTSSASCSQTITVNTSSGTSGSILAENPTSTISSGPTPTMRATGSTDITVGVGAVVLTLMLGGAFLFFAL